MEAGTLLAAMDAMFRTERLPPRIVFVARGIGWGGLCFKGLGYLTVLHGSALKSQTKVGVRQVQNCEELLSIDW